MDKTLLKGLAVLEAIAEMQGEARVIEDVAARVGLTRSNAHRTLQTLMHAGYVERDPVDVVGVELGDRQHRAFDHQLPNQPMRPRAHADRGTLAVMEPTGWDAPSTKRAAAYLASGESGLMTGAMINFDLLPALDTP